MEFCTNTIQMVTSTTGAEFYIVKTIDYGEICILSFITIFALYFIAKEILTFVKSIL